MKRTATPQTTGCLYLCSAAVFIELPFSFHLQKSSTDNCVSLRYSKFLPFELYSDTELWPPALLSSCSVSSRHCLTMIVELEFSIKVVAPL